MANLRHFDVEREKTFIGYNDNEPAEDLGKGYLADVLNGFCDNRSIIKRTGYSIIGDDLGAKACQALKGIEFADGTKEILSVFNGVAYKWTGSGNWAALSGSYTLDTAAYIDIVVANNNAYFFDGTNTVPKYNGTTMSTVATIPKGTMARWFHNQLHVAGMSADGNALKSSDIGDPETFTGGGSSDLDINPNDGDNIVGLSELNNELIIFKKNRIWSATGFGTAAIDLTDINEKMTGFGGISHRAIVNVGNDLLYLGFSGSSPIIRSLQRTRYGTIIDGGAISEDIEGTMDGLNKAQLSKACGMFDGKYAWFAVPNGSSTTNNLVLTYKPDTEAKYRGWTRHTGIKASCFDIFTMSSTAERYFGEAGADGKAYVLDSSTSDNGTAINFSITTRRYGGNFPEAKKKWKWLFINAKEVGDYDVTVDYSGDGFDYDTLGTLNLSGSGSVLPLTLDSSRLGTTDIKRVRYTVPKSRDYYMQYKIYDTSATSSITIRNWQSYYMVKTPLDF